MDDILDSVKTLSVEYPLYWHYDILHGLKLMAEIGKIGDPHCEQALDLLESKRLADSGWSAESRYYKTSDELKLGNDYIDWGGTSQKKRLSDLAKPTAEKRILAGFSAHSC